MTFNPAALSIDGATINSALVRTLGYAATSGTEGIVQGPDLKVSPLGTPGAGVLIASGSAIVLNKYQGADIDQSYVVSNPTEHTVNGAEIPTSSPSVRTYILAVVVGDSEFSASGHPFMTSGVPAPGDEDSFTWVRPKLILESSFNARNYPALALARITLRANTTTILSTDIEDIRTLARPRTQLNVGWASAPAGLNGLNASAQGAGSWERFPNASAIGSIVIPPWAVKAKIMGFVEGLRLDKAGVARMQPYIEGTALIGETTNIDEYVPNSQKERRTYSVGGEIDVRSVAGQTKSFGVRAQATSDAHKLTLYSDANTSVYLQVFFEERPAG